MFLLDGELDTWLTHSAAIITVICDLLIEKIIVSLYVAQPLAILEF